jgi:CheY-like chemotaxis protein
VLIVDDEVNLRFAMERRLRKDGLETGSASTVRHAIERLRSEPYDIVLCDLRMPSGDGTQLLDWLGSYSPSTKAIVVSAFVTPEIRERYRPDERLRILEKPVDLDVLVATIDELGPRKGFYGNAIEVELFDYVQMIALSGRDKAIEVTTPAGPGFIWFEHGDIVHVEYGEYRGEMAFYKLLSVNRGTFKEVYGRQVPRRTVVRSSTHLLMEAARRADEGLLEADGEDPTRADDTEVSFGELSDTFESETVDEFVDEEATTANGLGAVDLSGLRMTPIDEPDPDELFEEVPGETGRYAAVSEVSRPVVPVVRPSTGNQAVVGEPPDAEIEEEPEPDHLAEIVAEAEAEAEPEDTAASAAESSSSRASVGAGAGHSLFEDPDTRLVMLEQFWQFEGINGVAIISSTGKVLAEDMRDNSSLVTLAGFYMRGAARIARTLGVNVFDGVVARSGNGQQMVMVSMGAASAVLSVDEGHDPEMVRDMVMGVE